MAISEATKGRTDIDTAAFTTQLRGYLNPTNTDCTSACFRLAVELLKNDGLLDCALKEFRKVNEANASDKTAIQFISDKFLLLKDQAQAIDNGMFIKSDLILPEKGNLHEEFSMLERLHGAAPKYVAKALKEVKGRQGRTEAYFVELVQGKSLTELFMSAKRHHKPSLPVPVEDQLIEFMDMIHKARLLHGDITPGNVVISDKEACIKLFDPGVRSCDQDCTLKEERFMSYVLIEYVRAYREGALFGVEPHAFAVEVTPDLSSRWYRYAKEKGISGWIGYALEKR